MIRISGGGQPPLAASQSLSSDSDYSSLASIPAADDRDIFRQQHRQWGPAAPARALTGRLIMIRRRAQASLELAVADTSPAGALILLGGSAICKLVLYNKVYNIVKHDKHCEIL